MIIVFITLVIVAVVLFVISYFLTDKIDHLEDEFEQFTISTQQDTYQLNRKIRLLEKQLKDQEKPNKIMQTTNDNHQAGMNPILMQKVRHLHEQGYSIEDIENQTNLSAQAIESVLTKHLNR